MESTAQYGSLRGKHWNGAKSARREAGRRKPKVRKVAFGAGAIQSRVAGRKRDFPDAERLVKRLVVRELNLSFVPDAEQRIGTFDNSERERD